MELNKLVRKNIRELNSYSTARDEEGERISIYLDANENPFENGVNRYPDPKQRDLKKIISSIYNVPVKNIFAGNGSDEAIDLLFKVFCEPKSDNVLSISPTYGMYKVAAQINDVEFREILLEDDFSMNPEKMITATDSNTKLIFVCSPNNPTGNVIDENAIIHIANNFDGIVVIDEAYCEF
ncbi:MAG TPA: aminotransferase class I/II-fold pyridoxal phosphate-dependent enzyme, partial [Bacteroidales bacterium]|nr:aminotransferase class I/II-fold pyridoxal phosphate-dependent enzyme [Bacteroidales bacterium]